MNRQIFFYCIFLGLYNLDKQKINLLLSMQLSSASKYPNLSFLEQKINTFEQLPHTHCECVHCVNNTKPLIRPKAPRIVSKKEKQVIDSQAYVEILQKLADYQFFGKMKTPDVYIIEQAALVYTSKANDKIKRKDNQNNIEVKRYFDDHRRKIQTSFDVYNNSSLTQTINNIQPKGSKEIALLVYKDGTEQLLTEVYLSKTFQKRKNDPFWEQVSHIMQIPPQVKHPIQKYSFHFERTEDTLLQLNPIIQQMAQDLDNAQQKSYINSQSFKFQKGGFFAQQISQINPELKLNKNLSIRMSRLDSVLFYSIIQKNKQEIEEDIKASVYQLVCFLQISSYIRILNGIFQCFIDDKGRLYLSNIKNCILQNLQPQQRALIHDRYKPLEQIKLERISRQKIQYDKIQQEQLWRICSAIMNDCLQLRKVELKLIQYKKPNRQNLLKIFMKIFPQFKPQDIFSNKNWKNDLDLFMGDIRQKINSIIREDEGIRILRRFNIHFRRTFK